MESAFDRLSDTYSPSTTKSEPDRANSRDRSHSRSRPHRRDSSNRDHPRSRDCSRGVEESYDNTRSSYGTGTKHGYHSRDRDRSRYVKRGRESESPLSRVSKSDTSDGGHWKSKSKRHNSTDEDDLAVPWIFKELPPESIDGYKDLKAAFLAYFMQQKKHVKDPVKIHNIKQRDGETIEEFMERFKVETERMKRAPECMRISGFMHGVNNPELIKRLNKHVLKTMEEMMIATTAFIRGEAAAAGKKKGHTSTDEYMQLKKQIGELVRAGKLSHLIKEIKQGRDQPKVGKKEVPAKDKSMAIYMIQPWHRMTRQKVTQSFERVSKITFPSLTTSSGTEGPLVIEAEIGGHMIHRMYVDGGQLRLLVTIGDAVHSTKAWMNFMIVRSLSPYNGIIGRPGIREIQAVPSTAHGMLKFPVDGGIVTIRSTILIPAECATVITSSKEIPKEAGVRHENFKVALHPNFPDQEVAIGGTLSAKGRTKLCSLLKENLDIFAWQRHVMYSVLTDHLIRRIHQLDTAYLTFYSGQKKITMAGPITKEYISATSKSFISNNNNGKMIEKNFIEIEGTFLLKIRDNAFHENDGAAKEWFTNKCISTISTWDDLVENFVLKFYNLCEHDKEEETDDDNDPDVIDNVPEIFKIDDGLFNFDSPLCIAFEEFNHLLKIDPDLFTYDI
ncbi:reverse transcriptase domain-containing protein [Tanacetum coccineum]